MTKTILILAANPKDTPKLRLDQEVREIENGLQRAQKRDEFTLKQVWAVRPIDVRRAMLDQKPNIVHFCGHGAGAEGIAFEDENGKTNLISADALSGFFELFADQLDCVVLNACFSNVQAKVIAKHIEYVIGMKKSIGDNVALEFSVAFYDALGAGESIEFAYRLACNAIKWTDISQSQIPALITKKVKKASHAPLIPNPQNINKAYLFALMRDIFNTIDEIKFFRRKYFRTSTQPVTEKGFSVEIQSLISYCDENGNLDDLVEIIQRDYPDNFQAFRQKLFSQNSKSEASLIINRGVVELRLHGDIDLEKPNVDDFLDELKKSLVNYFGLKLDDVLITEIRKGSIIVKALFSEQAMEKIKQAKAETLSIEFGIEMLEILDSIFVKADFRGANLQGGNFSNNNLKGADLRGVNLKGAVLYQAILRLADLRHADLSKANLQGADLRGANLSEAILVGASLVGANLLEANIEKAILIGADLRMATITPDALESAVIDETTKLPTDKFL